jgi:hypothetical protein
LSTTKNTEVDGNEDRPTKIITHYVNPPIPIRSYDWIAYLDGDEEGLEGWGETEAEAVAGLLEQQNLRQREEHSK